MRIGGIWRYYMSTRWRTLALLSAMGVVVYLAILVFMMPYMAVSMTSQVNLGSGEVIISHTELNKPSLNTPFGTSGSVYSIFMLYFALCTMRSERRYLLSNNLTRYEFMLGTYAASVTMAVLLVAIRYVLDLICRIATYCLGFTINRMVWSPQLILMSTADYLPALVADMGSLILLAGVATLISLLFTRWKKTCIALMVLVMAMPFLLRSFLPVNWQNLLIEHASEVIQWLIDSFDKYKWLFMIDVPAWQALLQQALIGTVLYAVSYLVIRRLPVRTK